MMVNIEGRTILMVDDISSNLEFLGAMLRGLNFKVLAANSGAQGIAIAKAKQPDLILLDVQMPQMDGFEACRQLKSDSVTAGIPIIFVTAKNDIEDVLKGFETGAVDYITKPFHQAELLARIRTHLELKILQEQQQELMQRQSKLASMGEMIGAIAHQWRQPLNSLGIVIQDVKEAYRADELNEEYINEFVAGGMKQVKYMSETIEHFRNFFKPSKMKEEFSLKQATQDVLTLLSCPLKDHFISVDFRTSCDDEKLMATGLVGEFQQVVLNIVNNAKDALILKRIEQPQIDIYWCLENGRQVLYIEDNAGGIPQEIMEKIFEPYFTTKADSGGTGIGLSMSKMIVQKSFGGSLSVANTPQGARFRMEV